jgi:hypothetical protein
LVSCPHAEFPRANLPLPRLIANDRVKRAQFRCCAFLHPGNPHFLSRKDYRMIGRLILVAAAMALGTSGAIAAQPTSTPGGATPAAPATPATPATPADPSTGASATPATPATAADPATPATPGAQTTTDTTDTATTAQPDQKPKKHKKR